ncbi:MAG: hypothetical protein LBQ55_08010 [Treponema sp.]|jgi:hypothetical protein|nr:hypothetical protein [Treponema sp.]
MDTVESLREELESCLSGINAAGLGSLDPQNIAKLEKFGAAAAGLGMNAGKKLIDNLLSVLKSFKDGAAKEDSVAVRLTALEFYLQNIKSGGAEEEL